MRLHQQLHEIGKPLARRLDPAVEVGRGDDVPLMQECIHIASPEALVTQRSNDDAVARIFRFS